MVPGTYRAYVSREGRFGRASRLETVAEIVAFLREHLYDEEVRIVDADDFLVFRAMGGIDLYSRLGDLGINLPALYREIHATWVAEAQAGAGEGGRPAAGGEVVEPREPWEELYDAVGLSAGEIGMRHRAKRACRAARTVADVVDLLEGTYFDAFFQAEDGSREWGYLDRSDGTVEVVRPRGEEGAPLRVRLDPAARVRYHSSGEDIHLFVLLDPPE
jgi:hypothetical protein